jgi:hypothetical protein
MFTLSEIKFAVVSLALISAIGGSYFYGRHEQSVSDQLLAAKDQAAMQLKINAETDRRNDISQKFEDKLDNLKIVNTTITKNVTTELQKQIYTDCKLPASGTALINANADQLNAARHGTVASAPVAASTPQ